MGTMEPPGLVLPPRHGQFPRPVGPILRWFILTKGDEAFRDSLQARAPTRLFLRNVLLNDLQDPAAAQRAPSQSSRLTSQAISAPISQEHPDWFLLDAGGNRIRINGNYYAHGPGPIPGGKPSGWTVPGRTSQLELAGLFPQQRGCFPGTLKDKRVTPNRIPTMPHTRPPCSLFWKPSTPNFGQPMASRSTQPGTGQDPGGLAELCPYLDGAMLQDFAVDWRAGLHQRGALGAAKGI
jgi:hypothetical protein